MLVQRITVPYKSGKLQDAIALLGKERDRVVALQGKEHSYAKALHAVRMYSLQSDSPDRTVSEYEFENREVMDQFWATWQAEPEAQAFLEKYSPLIDFDLPNEFLDLF